jgi:F-type H+-transporting ATPase subunit O
VQDFLANPILSTEAKSKGIKDLLSSASKNPNELTQNFFEVLAENGRLYEADKVIADFLEIMSAHRGEVKVTITTAAPLEADLQKRLEKALQGSVIAGEGKSLIIENKVSEAVLGGLIVDFGDKTIDLSVASKVNKLNAQIARTYNFATELHEHPPCDPSLLFADHSLSHRAPPRLPCSRTDATSNLRLLRPPSSAALRCRPQSRSKYWMTGV